jgi:HNH endonuclease
MHTVQASDCGMFRYADAPQDHIMPRSTNSGHLEVKWSDKGQHVASAHRLVFNAWLGTVREGFVISHDDDDPTNNKWCNLRTLTHLVSH